MQDTPEKGTSVVPHEPFVFLIHSFTEKPVLAAIDVVKQKIEEVCGLKAISADEEVRELSVPENVRNLIRTCRFAVADITGNNPNVMLEIGMVEILGKPVVKIRNEDDDSRIPIDIGADLYCTYQANESTREPGRWDVGAAFVNRIPRFLDLAVNKSR